MNFSRLVPNPPQRSVQNQLPLKLPNWSLRASMAPLAEDGKNHSLGVLDSWMGLNCGVKGKEVKGSVKWTLFFVQPSYDIAKETLMSRFFCKFHCASSGKKNSFESLQWLGRKNKIISPKYVKALKCQQTTRLNLGLTAASKTQGVQVWSVLHALRRRGVLVELPGRLLWDTGSSPDKLMVWQYLLVHN